MCCVSLTCIYFGVRPNAHAYSLYLLRNVHMIFGVRFCDHQNNSTIRNPQAPSQLHSFPSHITPSPLPMSTASKEMLQQQRKALKKKASAGAKPSSLPQGSQDKQGLLPLHKDIGQNNSRLFEPQTPEFKPSPEWVSERVCLRECDVVM